MCASTFAFHSSIDLFWFVLKCCTVLACSQSVAQCFIWHRYKHLFIKLAHLQFFLVLIPAKFLIDNGPIFKHCEEWSKIVVLTWCWRDVIWSWASPDEMQVVNLTATSSWGWKVSIWRLQPAQGEASLARSRTARVEALVNIVLRSCSLPKPSSPTFPSFLHVLGHKHPRAERRLSSPPSRDEQSLLPEARAMWQAPWGKSGYSSWKRWNPLESGRIVRVAAMVCRLPCSISRFKMRKLVHSLWGPGLLYL